MVTFQQADLMRQHILDYADLRLDLAHAVLGVNCELNGLHTFMVLYHECLTVRDEGSGDDIFLFLNVPLNASFILSRLKSAGKRVGVKVYPHRLRHTCATQLLNAGCRITSIQRFLGHKKLNTTMIYARAHDKNVAEDYFKAMERVEKQLDLPTSCSIQTPSPKEIIALVDALFGSALTPNQFEIVSTLHSCLTQLEKQPLPLQLTATPIDTRIITI